MASESRKSAEIGWGIPGYTSIRLGTTLGKQAVLRTVNSLEVERQIVPFALFISHKKKVGMHHFIILVHIAASTIIANDGKVLMFQAYAAIRFTQTLSFVIIRL